MYRRLGSVPAAVCLPGVRVLELPRNERALEFRCWPGLEESPVAPKDVSILGLVRSGCLTSSTCETHIHHSRSESPSLACFVFVRT
jgi:hypothetical protein